VFIVETEAQLAERRGRISLITDGQTLAEEYLSGPAGRGIC
jgi:hypothetical protein